jgi:NADH-quinone oxidoreductase subunit A
MAEALTGALYFGNVMSPDDFMILAFVWPLAVYFVLAFAVVVVMIAVSSVLGERSKNSDAQSPYESGVVASPSGKLRYSVKYYLVAMFFVIFDVESVFIFAWAVAFRQLGWSGYVEIVVFIVVLLAALVYLWRVGALDWGETGRMKERNRT